MTAKKQIPLKVGISPELNERLEVFCTHKGRKSHLVRRALKELLDKLEKYHPTPVEKMREDLENRRII